MIYHIIYFFTKVVSFFYFPRRIYGREHIPAEGGFIIASNHVSYLDPVVMGISAIRRINFMAKIELFQKQPLGFILRKLGAFPVKRGEADLWALKEAIKRLKKGTPVLIFVEGTRRIGDASFQAQAGVGFLAVKSGVPVVPAYIAGSDQVLPPGAKWFTRNRVIVTFGQPLIFSNDKDYEQIARRIMLQIESLKSFPRL